MKATTRKPIWLLALGLVLIAGSHMTFNIEILAWISSVPFLLYLDKTKGPWSRLYFALTLILAWSICVFKIASDPLPLVMVPLFSVPIALIQLPAYLLWSKYRNRKHSYLLFPAAMVIMEWIQYTLTPLGSWGVAAYTQVDHIVLLQSASIFGIGGLSFLIYLVNSTMFELINHGMKARKKLISISILLAIVLVFGSLRLDIYKSM